LITTIFAATVDCLFCFLFSSFFLTFSLSLTASSSRLPLLGSYLLIGMAPPTLTRIRRDWILRWTWWVPASVFHQFFPRQLEHWMV
jgi:hypothetical protein